MKTYIHLWAGDGKAELQSLGYNDKQEISSEDLYPTIEKIFNSGLNVMLKHMKSGPPCNILFVDTKGFTQR